MIFIEQHTLKKFRRFKNTWRFCMISSKKMNKANLVYNKDLRKFRTNPEPKTCLEIESSGQGYAESRGL